MDGNINYSHPFTDIGIQDIGVGVALFDALRVGPDRLAIDNQMVGKIQIIAEFLNNEPDPTFTIQKIVSSNRSEGMEPVDHFVNFVNLEEKRRTMEKELDDLEEFIDKTYA